MKTQITSEILKIFKNFRTCGLKQIVQAGEDKTTFFFRKGMADKITQVSFEIDRGKDLYIVSFGKTFRSEYKQIKSYADCYVDQLQELFEQTTNYVSY